MMKKLLLLTIWASLLLAQAGAPLFQSIDSSKATILQKGEGREYCPSCAMHLPKHYKNSFAVKLASGEYKHFCSLHCFVREYEFGSLKNQHSQIQEILTVDLNSLALIDATKAHYVIGSDKKSSMTGISKYAFKNIYDAKQFAKEHGGRVMNYKAAYKVAMKDFREDLKMIHNNRGKMIYFVGEEIYNTKCDQKGLDNTHFHSLGDLKAKIKNSNVCGADLSDKQLQAISLYYYDVKLGLGAIAEKDSLQIPHDAKCPVCGMFVAKHPKWAAKIALKNEQEFYYDGVKDLFKHYFYTLNPKDIRAIQASDYYTNKAIDLTKSYLVIGSDVFGPMGNELIPFATQKSAKEFMRDHGGTKMLKFNEVTKSIVESLDR